MNVLSLKSEDDDDLGVEEDENVAAGSGERAWEYVGCRVVFVSEYRAVDVGGEGKDIC